MKKLFKTALLMLCGLMLLTGCSSSAKDAMKTEEKTADSKGKTEIQFWYGLGSIAGETMEEIIKEFNESQDKVKVVGVQQADYSYCSQRTTSSLHRLKH